jgi:hypothetical protein
MMSSASRAVKRKHQRGGGDNDVFGLESCKGKASGEEDEMR